MKKRTTYYQQKRRLLEKERQAFLRRCDVRSSAELKKRIEDGTIPEHPAWENYIELTNIEEELKRLDNAFPE